MKARGVITIVLLGCVPFVAGAWNCWAIIPAVLIAGMIAYFLDGAGWFYERDV